jgi:hypothetical protein
LALRQAAPWARKMSATSRGGRGARAYQAGGDRVPRLIPSRSNGLLMSRTVLTATRVWSAVVSNFACPRPNLNHAHIDALLEQMRGEAVP